MRIWALLKAINSGLGLGKLVDEAIVGADMMLLVDGQAQEDSA
jgi:hypothetical protein